MLICLVSFCVNMSGWVSSYRHKILENTSHGHQTAVRHVQVLVRFPSHQQHFPVLFAKMSFIHLDKIFRNFKFIQMFHNIFHTIMTVKFFLQFYTKLTLYSLDYCVVSMPLQHSTFLLRPSILLLVFLLLPPLVLMS